MKTRITTLALLSALSAGPVHAADDILYSIMVSKDQKEVIDGIETGWRFSSLGNGEGRSYSISPSGHVGFSGEIEEIERPGELGGSWLNEWTLKPQQNIIVYELRRLLLGGDQVMQATGQPPTVTLAISGVSGQIDQGDPLLVGENDFNAGGQDEVPRVPIAYGAGTVNPSGAGITGTDNPFFSWVGALQTPMIDTWDTPATDITGAPVPNLQYNNIRSVDRLYINGVGSNLIGTFSTVGTHVTSGDAIYTFSAPGGAPRRLVFDGQAVPGSLTDTINVPNSNNFGMYVNTHRDAFFYASVTGSGDDMILKFDDDTIDLSVVAREGASIPITAAPGPGYVFGELRSLIGLNNAGQYAFSGNFSNFQTQDSGEAIWVNKGMGDEVLIRTGDQAPVLGDPSVTIDFIVPSYGGNEPAPVLSESGMFFFQCILDGVDSGTATVLYLADLDGNYTLIAREGDPITGVEGATFGGAGFSFDYRKGPNEKGQVTFQATYRVAGVPGTFNGVFLTDAEHRPHLVGTFEAAIGITDPATNLSITLNDVSFAAAPEGVRQIADDGRMVYYARDTQTDDWFLFCADALPFGDLNQDRVRNADDIDELVDGVQANSLDDKFDMNGDGDIDTDDIDYWIGPIAGTTLGDVDLDGDVDQADEAFIFVNWGQSGPNIGWAEGDMDFDGDIDAADLALWQQNWNP